MTDPPFDQAAFDAEFPGTSATAAECLVALVRTSEMFLALANRALRHHGLSTTARQVLAVLEGAATPLYAGQVAQRLLVTTASMTTVLDTLERRGLITRTPARDDRRRVLVDVTQAGRALVDAFLPEIAAVQAAACAPLSDAQRRQMLMLLTALRDHMPTVDADAVARTAPERHRPASQPRWPSAARPSTTR